MKPIIAMSMITLCLVITLSACTNSERRDIGIASGAVVGGLAGHALTGGSAAGAVVGAAVGGVAGNELAK